MPRDFYPRREADILAFTGVLAARLAADWSALGVSEGTADDYVVKQAAFAEMYDASLDPTRRTPSVVAGKRAAARALESATRPIAGVIRCNRDLSMQTKVEVGILPAKTTYTRIAQPTIAPYIQIASTGPRCVTVRFLDPARTWRRALPKGVLLVTVRIAIGEQSPSPAGPGWCNYGHSSRATFKINVTDEDLPPFGKVWITARFTNPRGEHGPWATPVWANVPPGIVITKNAKRAA